MFHCSLWLTCDTSLCPVFTDWYVTCHCGPSSQTDLCQWHVTVSHSSIWLTCRSGTQSLRTKAAQHQNPQLQNLSGLECFYGSRVSLSTGSYEDCAHKRDWCNACAFLMRHDTSHQLHVYTQEFIAVFGGGGIYYNIFKLCLTWNFVHTYRFSF